MAAIGLAAGLGSFFAATITTVGLIFSLVLLRSPRRWVRQRLARHFETAIIRMRTGTNPSGVVSELHETPGLDVRSLSVRRDEDHLVVEADLKVDATADISDIVGVIAAREDVLGVDLA